MLQQWFSSRFLKGWLLASTALLFWAVLPIALKVCLEVADTVTITWFRFLFALVVVVGVQFYRGKLREFRKLNTKQWLMMTAAGTFLIGNYLMYLKGLAYVSAGPAQLFFQVAPLFLAIGGVLFFKETLNLLQIVCFPILFAGMLVFFLLGSNVSFAEASLQATSSGHEGSFWLGLILIMSSALSWTFYALVQKKLVKDLSSVNILVFIYALACVALFPSSAPTTLNNLSTKEWLVLIFCAINTLVAYGSFAESLKYWSAITTAAYFSLIPPTTFIMTGIAFQIWPDHVNYHPTNLVGVVGIVIVLIAALGIQCGGFLMDWRQQRTAKPGEVPTKKNADVTSPVGDTAEI
ncbi:DMT family transporter [Acanthopleuribacter pedis]|uniref:EamA family transporter n=1 Tax=Acanthopleuribacter pedis TaxID=442870 RepID=A0A8J7QDL8_9BACT|nr:EamA family transporter [Acanthopleuribacter pedis]MBO1321844.1 EamA family transporter [Acanthopleuribacter pedis]